MTFSPPVKCSRRNIQKKKLEISKTRKKRGPLYSIFKTELEQMHALGRKCEIEGLYASNESDEYVFSEFLAAKILRLR